MQHAMLTTCATVLLHDQCFITEDIVTDVLLLLPLLLLLLLQLSASP
jgi:hypothetical protein